MPYHLVFLLMLAGQPVDVATKAEPTVMACETDRQTIAPMLDAKVKTKNPDLSVVAACMDDEKYLQFLKATGRSDPDAQNAQGSEKVD